MLQKEPQIVEAEGNCYKLWGHRLVIHSKPIVMNTVINI